MNETIFSLPITEAKENTFGSIFLGKKMSVKKTTMDKVQRGKILTGNHSF